MHLSLQQPLHAQRTRGNVALEGTKSSMKALTAKVGISGLAECMESLSDVGYKDSTSSPDVETNIVRLYHDTNVLSCVGWGGGN